MSEKDIEDRLRSHAKAFDSLLNLIPAKLYFTQDNSDQWKKRKQTKEESQAAKRAKLDPDQAVTVKEVEEERARERAVREEKRRKLNEDGVPYETKSQMKARKKEEKRRERREKKEGSGSGGKVKAVEKTAQTEDSDQNDDDGDEMVIEKEEEEEKEKPISKKKADHPPKSPSKQTASPKKEQHHPAKRKDAKPNGVQLKVNGTEKTGKASIIQKPTTVESSDSSEDDDDDDNDDDDDDSEEEEDDDDITADMDKMAQDPSDSSEASDSETESIQRIPGLSAEEPQATTTTSSPSPVPSNTTDTSTTQKTLAEKLKTSKDPLIQQQLKERLAKRIEELRHARKADGGEIPRTRTELMEQRRKRDEQRKERKKQMRLQAKVEAEKAQQDATNSTDSNAGGKKSQPKKVTTAPANYTFGNVKFDDGDKLTADLEGIKAVGKKRGPSDVAGALKHVEAKKARLAGMNEEKRADIQEKDRWSKALKMASGEKLQDDEGLLKKSLKRQEKAKKKSEKEWKERNANVEKAKAMRQKKREANLAARKEQKKSGKGGKKARKVPSKKSKGRAGFEGTGFGGAGKKRK